MLQTLGKLWRGLRGRPGSAASANRATADVTCDVKRPRDPRAQWCLDRCGQEVAVRYRGRLEQIVPLEVYTRPERHRTYVRAGVDGRIVDLRVEDIELVD
jgi:hypothetical protein